MNTFQIKTVLNIELSHNHRPTKHCLCFMLLLRGKQIQILCYKAVLNRMLSWFLVCGEPEWEGNCIYFFTCVNTVIIWLKAQKENLPSLSGRSAVDSHDSTGMHLQRLPQCRADKPLHHTAAALGMLKLLHPWTDQSIFKYPEKM